MLLRIGIPHRLLRCLASHSVLAPRASLLSTHQCLHTVFPSSFGHHADSPVHQSRHDPMDPTRSLELSLSPSSSTLLTRKFFCSRLHASSTRLRPPAPCLTSSHRRTQPSTGTAIWRSPQQAPLSSSNQPWSSYSVSLQGHGRQGDAAVLFGEFNP